MTTARALALAMAAVAGVATVVGFAPFGVAHLPILTLSLLFGYASQITPILLAFIALAALEIPILALLLPWPAVRTPCLRSESGVSSGCWDCLPPCASTRTSSRA